MRAVIDCGKTDGGDVREEMVVGNACGGKLSSHESKAILLRSHIGDGTITTASLPSCQHQQLNNREAGPSNT